MVVIHNIFFFLYIYLFSDSLQTPIVFGLVRTFSVFIPIMAHFNPFTVAQPQITLPSALWTCMSEGFFLIDKDKMVPNLNVSTNEKSINSFQTILNC